MNFNSKTKNLFILGIDIIYKFIFIIIVVITAKFIISILINYEKRFRKEKVSCFQWTFYQ